MLLALFNWLGSYYHPFFVVNYISLRVTLAALTALIISVCLGRPIINYLQRMQIGQVVRDDGPQAHLSKAGTPTMGGVLLIFSITVSTLLWADWGNVYTWILLGVLLSFGFIGFLDDYLKLTKKSSGGLKSRYKYLLQSLLGLAFAVIIYVHFDQYMILSLAIPFTKAYVITLGVWFVLLGYFVIVGTSNAVNLTDGLDGLAITSILLVALGLGVFAYASCNASFADYLGIIYIPGTEEVVLFCVTIAGAGVGFLWYNAYPAEVFMGDVGSLSLGAVLGCVALILRQELILFIMGFVFVIETFSVILQVGSFKLRHKRIFKMAPIHHHFELKGWHESKVVVRFSIITALCVLIALASLKIR